MTEEHVFDLLPGFALGILDEEDLLRAANHLSHCAGCQRALASYAETADRLVLAVPPQPPAADLKNRVIQRAAVESRRGAEVAQPVERAGGQGWRQALRAWFGGRAGLAFSALALLVLLLGINNFLLWQRVNNLQTHLPGEGVRVVRMLGTENAPGASGYVMVFENDPYGSLTVENAPALNPGFQYQIWLIKNGERASGGVFSVDYAGYGVLKIDADVPLDTFDSFGITVEPSGGSPAPTGMKVLGGDL